MDIPGWTKRSAALLAAALACHGAGAGEAAAPATATSQALHRFFDSEWERSLREFPETATVQGDMRNAGRWTDESRDAIAAREAADRDALARLHAIDRGALGGRDRIDFEVYDWTLGQAVAAQKFRAWLEPVNQFHGPQTRNFLLASMRFATERDYRLWIDRLDALPALVGQTIALMREGAATGRTPPRVVVERAAGQVAAQVVDDPARSPFFEPFLAIDPSLPADRAERIRQDARAAIRDRVVPAFRSLDDYMRSEYLPRARTSIALGDQPGGAAYYEYLVGDFTNTRMSADEIHSLGLAEVERIRGKMDRLRREIGFTGTLAEFFVHLRTDPKYFYRTPEELLQGYRALAKRIDPELVRAFATIPRLPYGVTPIPGNLAADAPTAYYEVGAMDGSRAGSFLVNLDRPASARPRWEMLPLTLHEAVPGHHFQFARGLELPEAPAILRTFYSVAYSEGWALYAEQVGYDMGLYGDPLDRFGQLSYEMWRAVRLVVDTGMHARGWSRERAIAFMRENVPMSEANLLNEIDRYIADPGQALAYKIGQLRISALREKASEALGERFDLRRFHDAVLGTGSVPLPVLESAIARWIEGEKLRLR